MTKRWQVIENILLGGPGSGNRGHTGGVGGPGNPGGSSAKGGGATLYHGTRSGIVDSVLSEGLKVGKRWHYRDPSVYTAEDDALALGYAIDRARNTAPIPKYVEALVFEIRVPESELKRFVPDDKLPGLTIGGGQKTNASWRLPADIPKDWIVGYKLYRADSTKRSWVYTPADDVHTLFDVVEDVRLAEERGLKAFVPIVYIPAEEDENG